MALETGAYISDLNDKNPTPGDPKSQGDDHIRLIKETLVDSFPKVAGPVDIAHDQFASKAFVTATAFQSILPGQPGGALPYRLITKNSMAGWQSDSLFDDDDRLAEAHAVALSF